MAKSAKKTGTAKAKAAFKYDDIDASVKYIVEKLALIDKGAAVDMDFIASEHVTSFCKLIGCHDTWAGKSLDEITLHGKPREEKPVFGPPVVRSKDARAIMDILLKMIKNNRFKSRDGEAFKKTCLNDFLPADMGKFSGKPTLGHFWEFRYALAVELEHGRLHGTNVTNNHPLLTALIVMAHLTEDTLYYARLWVMETEGEIANGIADGLEPKELAEMAEELNRAKIYLAKRLYEKFGPDEKLPE